MFIILGLFLFLNAALLTILVPGGPIENRDFTNLTGIIYWGFNIFLISLGILTFLTTYYVLIRERMAIRLGIILSICYLIVYILDLAKIFPRSSTKMSNKLMLMEIVNSLNAVFTIIFSLSVWYNY